MIGEKFIGKNGRSYVNQRVRGGLGFKDLCKFNKAMLAKQVWWVIHDKESLFYKVFKAKYFPKCSIFEAKTSTGSFAWKSILWSRYLIEKRILLENWQW